MGASENPAVLEGGLVLYLGAAAGMINNFIEPVAKIR